MATTPSDIQQQVYDLISRTSDIAIVPVEREAIGRTLLTPGQRVSAEVLMTLPNNRTQVQIGSDRFNLELPMQVRPGQRLDMTFISEDPRSTFAIARQAGTTPPVSLSDASRLLSLLVSNEQIVDPKVRSSLQNIGDMLRQSSGQADVMANLMDEALTYGSLREAVKAPAETPGDSMKEAGDQQGSMRQQTSQTSAPPTAGTRSETIATPAQPSAQLPADAAKDANSRPSAASPQSAAAALTPDQAQRAAFETNAARILKNIAQNSRFLLTEAASQPATPLPLLPGQEVDAAVVSTLPGGRAFVQVAGTTLELILPRTVQAGESLRLTYISSQPKPLFALPRTAPDTSSGAVSDAGRWLSALEHRDGGGTEQQKYVLERLSTVLKNLPPDSPAFTAILDEAITYQNVFRGKTPAEQSAAIQTALLSAQQTTLTPGNGIVLSDDMAKLLQAVIKGNRLTLLETISQQAAPAGLVPGQQLKGEVLESLGGERFNIKVAGQVLEFTLPKGVQRGDTVNLFFITDEPRQTFLMTRFGRPGDARVSDTGRWLSGFLGETAAKVPAQETFGIMKSLISSPPSDAPQVGKMLQQGLRESGLFYESHLSRWFGGDYRLDDLLKEPQGRLSPRIQQNPAEHHPAAKSTDRGPLAGDFAQPSGHTSTEVVESLFKKAGSSLAREANIDQRTLPVVGEQLTTLQNGQLVFRGDLFPGQRMEWTVTEREAHRNQTGERERSWETSLKLNLPQLGPISVKLDLNGTRISLDVRAESGKTVPLLEAGRERLTDQLDAAGLTAVEIGIRHGEP